MIRLAYAFTILASAIAVAQAAINPDERFDPGYLSSMDIADGVATAVQSYLARFEKKQAEVIYTPGERILAIRLNNGQIFSVEISEERSDTD